MVTTAAGADDAGVLAVVVDAWAADDETAGPAEDFGAEEAPSARGTAAGSRSKASTPAPITNTTSTTAPAINARRP